jgi:hypothetical protein
MKGPGDHPAHPKEVHPAFHGSFDWHSCLEMHWTLIRLHESTWDVPRAEVAALLDERLTKENLAAEAAYCTENPGHSRPYGQSWALHMAHQARDSRWAEAIGPLARTAERNFLAWLPKLTYAVRDGMHSNTAFALSRMLPWAEANSPELAQLAKETALRLYSGDRDYPTRYEPSGYDFLSPSLCEAELMSRLLPDFPAWLDRFLPDPVYSPAVVSDSSDGLIAHLHGLNLSRAWAFRRIAAKLPTTDPRVERFHQAAVEHAEASLDHISGEDFMVEHWLAAYALLLLDDGEAAD